MNREESIQFYKAHAKRLYNISLRIVRDSGAAEEIMQDTILRFISSDVVPKEPAKVAAWLGRTCIRMSIDAVRKKSARSYFLMNMRARSVNMTTASPPKCRKSAWRRCEGQSTPCRSPTD